MKRIGSGRSLFLFEICLLFSFFLVAVLVCASLFVFSHGKNTEANALNSAAVKAVSIADTIKSCGRDTAQARDLLGADEDFTIYYDENWHTDGEKIYQAKIDLSLDEDMLTATIRFAQTSDGKEIFKLETKEYLGVNGE